MPGDRLRRRSLAGEVVAERARDPAVRAAGRDDDQAPLGRKAQQVRHCREQASGPRTLIAAGSADMVVLLSAGGTGGRRAGMVRGW